MKNKIPYGLALFLSLMIPLSITFSQTTSFILLPLSLILMGGAIRTYKVDRWVPVSIILFGLCVLSLSLFGLQLEGSAKKLYRFLSFGVVYAIPLIISRRDDPEEGLLWLVRTYLIGVFCLFLFDAVRVPLEVSRGIGLFDTGNMRDPQFYMTAVILFGAGGMGLWPQKSRFFAFVGWLGVACGLLIHFKRGAWIAAAACLGGLAVVKRKYIILLLLGVFGLIAVALPATRERISQLKDIRDPQVGGRYALWTEAAPEMIKDYPMGIGFKKCSHELLLEYTSNIQPGLDHLHNNILQIRVELGWPGAMFWALIQLLVVVLLIRALWVRRAYSEKDPLKSVLQGCLFAFLGLHLNGLVEYNYGDSEILILYSWLIGISVATAMLVFKQAEIIEDSV